MKQQLLIINRSRQRAPNLSALDRFLLGFWSLFLNPCHLRRAAVVIQPSTLLKFHTLLMQRKYRLLFSSAGSKRKTGPIGPSQELIQAIVEMKQCNPRFGCPRIASTRRSTVIHCQKCVAKPGSTALISTNPGGTLIATSLSNPPQLPE
ncbi:MAG: hypothetical protein WBP44_03750 [Gammaproteobacteria bacterium]